MSWEGLPEDYSDVFGFVYIIKNNHPDAKKKFYIGCKQCLKRVKKKPLKGKKRNRIEYKDNDVEKYWGSSNELLKDIESLGLEHFSRKVIELCDSKFHMKFAELNWQLMANALFDEKFYNGVINVRLARPKNYVDKPRDIGILDLC